MILVATFNLGLDGWVDNIWTNGELWNTVHCKINGIFSLGRSME